jgi:parallel beta-helix repeat protein
MRQLRHAMPVWMALVTPGRKHSAARRWQLGALGALVVTLVRLGKASAQRDNLVPTIVGALLLPFLLPPLAAATTIVGGNLINQTWTPAGNPYVVQGDVTVPLGSFLTIQAGTVVELASSDGQVAGLDTARVEMTIKGTLNVNGSAAAPVVFKAQTGTAPSTWYGIVLQPTAATIQFATIQHAVAGILVQSGSPTIDAVAVSDNDTGISVVNSATPSITNAVLSSNATGIALANVANPTIVNCTIYGNTRGLLSNRLASGTPPGPIALSNTIITDNGTAMEGYVCTCPGPCTTTCCNQDSVATTYSDVFQNGSDNNCGITIASGTGSISADPKYVSPPADLHLQVSSPCIDTAGSTGAPNHDLDGTTRPLDGDGMNAAEFDMGAYEYSGPPPTTSTTTLGSTTTTTTATCDPTPMSGCHVAAPLKSSISLIDNADPTKQVFKWKWKAATSDTTAVGEFRDPVNATPTLRVCVYDGSGGLQPLVQSQILAGGTCAGKPCWKVVGNVTAPTGAKYANKAASPNGLTNATLKAGVPGKAQVALKGKGSLLSNPADLQLMLPVTVQLLIGDGTGTSCWQTTYSTASKSIATKFTAKGP